jgi:hypothetical protein
MNTDKLIEKLLKFFSDPRGRELLKSLVYLAFPIIILAILSKFKREQPVRKTSAGLRPKIRGSAASSLVSTETVKETMAKEQRKIAAELQQLFGREENSLARSRSKERTELERSQIAQESPLSEPREPGERKTLRQELPSLFLTRDR